MKEKMIQTTSFKGLIKQSLNFAESEGLLLNFNIQNNFMVVFTSNNFMKTFDIARKEYKQMGITRRFEDSSGPLGEIKSCVRNAVGNKINLKKKFFIMIWKWIHLWVMILVDLIFLVNNKMTH